MEIKSVVRDNAPDKLKKIYQKVEGRYIKAEERKAKLCSLFLVKYKETLKTKNLQQLQVIYADMLEIIRTLMVITKTNVKEIKFDTYDQHVNDWYKNATPIKQKSVKLTNARMDLLQKFDELLQMETEAVSDQLIDMLMSFKCLIEVNEFSWAEIEKQRRNMYKNLGGYSKGIYLESVSHKKTNTTAYSV